MLNKTKKKRTKKCLGCKKKFVVPQKKALSKGKYCTHKCFLETRDSKYMAKIAEKAVKHGMYKHPIYMRWSAMIQRCNNPNNSAYDRYGGAGITVDSKWLSFVGFYEDMGDSFKDGLTLDRIDGKKGYYKENCRWATRREQSANIKNNVLVECGGEVLCASECARKLGIHRSTIDYRIKHNKIKLHEK